MKNSKLQNQVEAIFNTVNNAILSRIESAENDNARKELKVSSKLFTLHLATVMNDEKIDFEKIAKIIAINDKNHADFFAQKALIKYFKTLESLSQGLDRLDRYTKTYLKAMLLLNGKASNVEIQQGLSKAIISENLDLQKNALHIASTTSSTQASSTRRMLSFANVIAYDSANKTQSFTSDKMRERIAKIVA